jgi:hypothetical protein
MKNFLMLTAFILLSAATIAQSNKEDIAIVQNMFGKDKKELVQAYMTIPEAQKAGFWTMYDEYEESRKKLGRERIALIQDYANAYDSLNDKKASDLMNRKILWLNNYTGMQKKYYASFAKLIGGIQASKFFQLEDYLENNIRLAIQESIPFIDELDKTKMKEATAK